MLQNGEPTIRCAKGHVVVTTEVSMRDALSMAPGPHSAAELEALHAEQLIADKPQAGNRPLKAFRFLGEQA